MATGAQLRQHDENKREHRKRVAAVRERVEQALPIAAAQLAATIANSTAVLDITQRSGFDPARPDEVLVPREREHLVGAMLVVNAIATFVHGSLRLENQIGPRVVGGTVTQGRV